MTRNDWLGWLCVAVLALFLLLIGRVLAADVVVIGGKRYAVFDDAEVVKLAATLTAKDEEIAALTAKLKKGGCL